MDEHTSRSRMIRWVRALALIVAGGGFLAFVRASDAEAAAVFDAGGDAGMWDLGILLAAVLLGPGAVLLLLSVGIGRRPGAALAATAGILLLVPTTWLAANLYPPDRRTDEGAPLARAQWDHAADLYLVAFVLLGTAGALVLLSALSCPTRAGRGRSRGGVLIARIGLDVAPAAAQRRRGRRRRPDAAASRGEPVVFVRTTEVQADPAKVDDGIATIREETFPAVSDMDGCVGMSLLVDRASGRCIAATAWESEEAMRETAERVRPLRDKAVEMLDSSGSEVHQWEVAVVHRDHAAPSGACARLTWLRGDLGTGDHAIDTFKMAVLPRIQEMAGFCSASLMIDRDAGRMVGTVAFDSREALEATREAAKGIRERVASELGATVERVEEMEIAFAHLHVPEMA